MANMRMDAVEKRSLREVLDRAHGKSGACCEIENHRENVKLSFNGGLVVDNMLL